MTKLSKNSRILMYSHDSFGLGHLRRCRAIAHSLVEKYKNLSVLILTGSPIIGSFDFCARVDFVRIPGVIKLRNGDYTSLNLHIDIEDTLALRASIIEHTAAAFDPDIFIVDKEPLGLRGEVESTLNMLKKRGTSLILGLRDILDDPSLLAPEWERKNALPALKNLYDQIWVFGLAEIHDPLEGIELPGNVHSKMIYTGYLKRSLPEEAPKSLQISKIESPYILVTPGGGGDGEELVDWVLSAYELDDNLPHPALIVLGPFMQSEKQVSFLKRAEKLSNVEMITFDAHMETLVNNALAMVTMGGYNTFCEILSFNKPALIMPRTKPRLEQYIRASRTEALGLTSMIEDDNERSPKRMAQALYRLSSQRPPMDVVIPDLLEGLEKVNRLCAELINSPKIKQKQTADSIPL